MWLAAEVWAALGDEGADECTLPPVLEEGRAMACTDAAAPLEEEEDEVDDVAALEYESCSPSVALLKVEDARRA